MSDEKITPETMMMILQAAAAAKTEEDRQAMINSLNLVGTMLKDAERAFLKAGFSREQAFILTRDVLRCSFNGGVEKK